MQGIDERWRAEFWLACRREEHASRLRDTSLRGRLGEWTNALTAVTVATCTALDWQASAKGHHLDLLPVPHYEYLTLDTVAFPGGVERWRFPVAVMELENSQANDRIAYSLWKVLCVRSHLRIVFCYRRGADEGASLVRYLRDEVVQAMPIVDRVNLDGATLVVVGSRDDSVTFPYDFFKWWRLDPHTGGFTRQ